MAYLADCTLCAAGGSEVPYGARVTGVDAGVPVRKAFGAPHLRTGLSGETS